MLLNELACGTGAGGLALLVMPPGPDTSLPAAGGGPACKAHAASESGASCLCHSCAGCGCCTCCCRGCVSSSPAAAAAAAPAGMSTVAAPGGLGPMLSPSPFISRDCRLRISVACDVWGAWSTIAQLTMRKK